MRKTEEIINELLSIRGITGQDEIAEFLSDHPQRAYDPFLLHNMEAGVDLILSEIDKNSRICIYGDYDADGVTSVCILLSFLKHLTNNLTYYIPSRFTDGYGLNKTAIKGIRDKGADMIITVDCGSVSHEEVEYAKSMGLKILVTDHHTIDDVKADCLVINPKQAECQYPFKGLAGCGVAFKLAQAIRIRKNLDRSILNECLDLVAIGTVADIVPLIDENRTMVKYGLYKINQGSRKSISILARGISLNSVTSEGISFGIAPHINAVGRMSNAAEAVKLFLAENEEDALKQTQILKDCNYRRKLEQEKSYKDCLDMPQIDDDFIVIVRDDIHEGIGGIVAGKIKENKNRPCAIITPTEDGRWKGTSRSIDSINLYDFLNKYNDLFDTFGGHKGACGFSLKNENLETLIDEIGAGIRNLERENPDIFKVMSQYDMVLDGDECTLELCEALKKLEPFGQNNPSPKFMIKNIMSTNWRYLGNENKHMKFQGIDTQGNQLECIIFNKAQEYADLITCGRTLDIIGSMTTNTWNGRTNVQIILEDILSNDN